MAFFRKDVAVAQRSDVGVVRLNNEDFFGSWESDDDAVFDRKGRLFIVCDGMGGHAGGEKASRLAVETIIAEYEKDDSSEIVDALSHALEAANDVIHRAAARERELQGMGATCTALVHHHDFAYFAQVGDSRGYLIRNGKIKQMTKDHSLVQTLVDQGLLEREQMESHPDKNIILRSLGTKPQVEVDVSYLPVQPGDTLLLCSDGLSGLVSDDEILAIVQASRDDLEFACDRLIELANRYGGIDNITVQILRLKTASPLRS